MPRIRETCGGDRVRRRSLISTCLGTVELKLCDTRAKHEETLESLHKESPGLDKTWLFFHYSWSRAAKDTDAKTPRRFVEGISVSEARSQLGDSHYYNHHPLTYVQLSSVDKIDWPRWATVLNDVLHRRRLSPFAPGLQAHRAGPYTPVLSISRNSFEWLITCTNLA